MVHGRDEGDLDEGGGREEATDGHTLEKDQQDCTGRGSEGIKGPI